MTQTLTQLIAPENLIKYQFRKDDSNEQQPYFWGKISENNTKILVGNILSTTLEKRKTDLERGTIASLLKDKCAECLKREKQFITAVKIQSNNKIPQSDQLLSEINNLTVLSDQKTWKRYVEYFNVIVLNLINSDNDITDLLNQFRSGNFISSISGQVSSMSSSILKGDKTYDEFFNDLINLFFEEQNVTNGTQIFTQRKIESEEEFTKFINNYQFPEAVKKEINDSVKKKIELSDFAEAIDAAISSQFKNEKATIKKQKTNNKLKKNEDKKNISGELEKKLKKIFLQSLRNIFTKAGIDDYVSLTPVIGSSFDVALKLRPAFSEQEGSYSVDVSMKIADKKNQNTEQAKNEIFYLFWNFIGNALKDGSGKDLWMGKHKEKEDKHYRLKKVVHDAIFKNFDQVRSNADAVNILSAYGEAQVKGVLGELAAAIQFAFLNNTQTSITGSETTRAGQLSFDVAIKIANNQFGIQVKNFNKIGFNNFYKTDFQVSNSNNMDKYFGKANKEKYWFLFANGEMLKDSGIIQGSLKEKMIDSFYNYIDNFLRINAADINKEFDLTRSDIFIVKNMIIPSSYFISLVYQKFVLMQKGKDNKKQEKSFFDIQGKFLPIPILQNNPEPILINKNLFNDLQINFHGISSQVTLKELQIEDIKF